MANSQLPGRTPPRAVLLELRQEIGFCCPVDGCGSPYLTWHHFDPPWRTEHHHRPEGMIALCREHADKADAGAFTDDQLRELKRVGRDRAKSVRGRFDWMRLELLAVIGGNFYYRTPIILQIGTVRCIWFNRDDEGYLLLNFKLPTLSGRPRAEIEDNSWSVLPDITECICPPNGRLVHVAYENGDQFRAEFFTLESPAELQQRYPNRVGSWAADIPFPVAAVELWETSAGRLELAPTVSRIGGASLTNCFFQDNRVGIMIGASPEEVAVLFPPTT